MADVGEELSLELVKLRQLLALPRNFPLMGFFLGYIASLGADEHNLPVVVQDGHKRGIDDNRFFICVADVSGKGIPAALLMSNFQASLRTITRQTEDLQKIIHELNHIIRENSKGERFVLVLNSLLNDCGCSKPNSYAISLTDKFVVDNLSFAFSISLLCMCS